MYTAPRKGLELNVGTNRFVGPNTYTPSFPTCKYNKKNYAPFLSTSVRKHEIYPSLDAYYDVEDKNRSRIKYGNSMQFTEKRKYMTVKVDPPDESKLRRPQIYKGAISEGKKTRGKLYVCNMPYTLEASAPSVPTKIDENGYWLTEDQKLVKIPSNKYDCTLGPAFYKVPRDELCYNSLKYKGCAWSKRRAKRTLSNCDDNTPGPGAYSPKIDVCPKRYEDENFKQLARKCCNVPRYICQLVCKARKEDIPAPGTYDIINLDKMGEIKDLTLTGRPFINGAKRFIQKKEDELPGPQSYLVCDCFKHKKDFSIKNVAFSTEADRFARVKDACIPGPSDYQRTIPKCVRYKPNAPPPFNSSNPRDLTTKTGTEHFPGPAAYCIYSRGIRCCPQEPKQRHSVFSSMVCRFKKNIGDPSEPTPATYSITPAFRFTVDKQSHQKRKVGFNSSLQRDANIFNFAGSTAINKNPGVGDYDLEKSKKGGQYFNLSPRFRIKTEKRPGPAYYTFHPSVAEAVYKSKSTHNSRLMKEVKLKYPSSQVPRPVVMKTDRKFLRWFAKGNEEYKHCWT